MKTERRSPDPIAEPNAYQAMLLGLLGDDDPAAVQSGTLTELPALIADAGANLRTPPAPGEWSVVELLGHITDAELVASGRYRWILAHDTPTIPGYDQDLWASRLNHRDAIRRSSSPFTRPSGRRTSPSGAGRRSRSARATASTPSGAPRATS